MLKWLLCTLLAVCAFSAQAQVSINCTAPGTVVEAGFCGTARMQPYASSAIVASGASLTGAIDLSAGQLVRIAIPPSWTAANLTFQTSPDNVSFNNLYDASGNEYTVAVTGASTAILIPAADFIGVRYLKIRSGTSGSPVAQGAARTLTLVLKPF